MANEKYRVKVGDSEYMVDAPDANTAWRWANMTHEQEMAPPPVAATPEARKDVGLLGALKAGTISGVRAFGKTKEAVSGGKPEEETAPNYSDNGIKKFAEQALYGLGRSAPVIGGGVAGASALGAAGSLVGPEGTAVGGLTGEVLGSAAVAAAQELGPYYAEELKKSPENPQAAFDMAVKRAGTSGVFTGASFGLFRFAPFKKLVGDTLLQAFAIQPAVAAAGQAAQNTLTGRPTTEGVAEGYLPSVGATLVPLVGTHYAGKAVKAVTGRGKTSAAPSEAPPEAAPAEAAPAEAPQNSAFNELVARHMAEGRTPEEADILARNAIIEPSEGGAPADGTAPTRPIAGGDQSGVPDTGGPSGGEPAAAPAGPTAAEPLGRPVATAEGAGAGEGVLKPTLADTISGLPRKERTALVKGVVSDLMPEGVPKASANKAVNKTAQQIVRDPTLDPQSTLNAVLAEQGVEIKPTPTIDVSEPVKAAPEVAAPEVAAPEVAAPEVAAPKVAAPEVAAPKVAAPEVAAPPPPEFGAPERYVNESNPKAEIPTSEAEALRNQLEYFRDANGPLVQEMRARLFELEKEAEGASVAREAKPENAPETVPADIVGAQKERPPLSREQVEEISPGLTQEQVNQQKVNKEIGLARDAGEITNNQVAQLRDMMQPQYHETIPNRIIRAPLKAAEVRKQLNSFKEFQRTASEAQTPTRYIMQRGENAMPGTGDVRAVYTRALDAQREVLSKKLTKRLKQLGLHDVALRVPDMIKERTATGEQSVSGAYYKKIIGVALDSDTPLKTLNHEAVHALKGLKLFTAEEWKILVKQAEDEWIAKHRIKERYGDATPDKQAEEAIAEAFKDFAANKQQHKNGAIQRIFAKIAKFLRATKDVFATHEEIFRGIERGDIGRRARSPVLDAAAGQPPAFQRAAEKKLDDARRVTDTITKSREATKLNSGIGALLSDFRSDSNHMALLGSIWDRLSIKGKRAFVFTLPTEDIARMAAKSLPGAKRVSAAVDGMYRLTNRSDMSAAKIVDKWSKFNQTYKGAAEVLDDAILYSTLLDESPFATRPDKPTYDQQKFYEVWDKLGTFGPSKEGHAVYKEVFDAHRKGLSDTERFTLEDITLSEMPGNIRDEKTPKGQLYKEMSDMFAKARKIKNYFPLKRFGEHWYRIGNGKDREFAMFESAALRDAALKKRVAQLQDAGDARPLDTMVEEGHVSTGTAADALEKELTSRPDSVLKKVYELIDKHGSADSAAVKKSVFDAYLRTLFNEDIRKGLLKREGVAGFSTDTLRVFAASQAAAARQTAKLLYGRQIRNELSALNSVLKNNPNAENLRPLVDTMTARVNRLLDAPPQSAWDRAAMMGNKAVFLYMLTSPKSAIVNLTQVPIVALPNLAAEFKVPMTKATAALGKNMSKDIYNPKNIDRRTDLSPEEKIAHKNAYDRADADGLFSTNFVSSMLGKGREPTSHVADSPGAAAWRGATKMAEAMGKLFQASESRSRKLVYMTAFDMALKEARASGAPMEEAVSRATERARRTTNDSMFNFAEWNKSELQTAGPVARVATQFTAYQTQVLSYILRNGFNALKDLKAGERSGAATRLFGTLAMTALFGGVTALPFYHTTMGLLSGFSKIMRSMLPPDEEGADDESNPLYAQNLDLWFRSHFVPSYFGAGSGMADTFGLDDKDAELIGQAFLRGPVSAYTGMDFSKSVSIDMPFLNSATGTQSSSARGALHDAVFDIATGPAGGMLGQMFGAAEDWSNGDTSRALEKMAPAFLRGGLKAYRMTQEGLLNTSEEELRSREYFTAGKLLATAVGFGDTEANEAQDMAWAAQKAAAHIESARSRVYANIEHALALAETHPSDAAEAKVEAAYALADKFNEKYPEVPIMGRDLAAAVRGHQRAIDTATVGYAAPKKYRGYAADILGQYEENADEDEN